MSAISGTRRQIKEMADGTIRLSVDIDPRFNAEFHRLFPTIDMPVALAPLVNNFESQPEAHNSAQEDDKTKEPPGYTHYKEVTKQLDVRPFAEQARELKLSDFFRRPEVWKKIGTDEQFAQWIQLQKCVVCCGGDWVEELGELRCEAAHVRRAGESGTGYKADYARVPMCHNHHINDQHHYGETEALCTHIELGGKTLLTDGKEWFNALRIKWVTQWCWITLKAKLGYESWASVPPEKLKAWAQVNGIDIKWLPQAYR